MSLFAVHVFCVILNFKFCEKKNTLFFCRNVDNFEVYIAKLFNFFRSHDIFVKRRRS